METIYIFLLCWLPPLIVSLPYKTESINLPEIEGPIPVETKIYPVRTSKPNAGFWANISGNGHDFQLHLRPASHSSIFSPNFKYTMARANGETVTIEEQIPSPKFIQEIENRIHVDKNEDSILSLKKAANGVYDVHGVIGDMAIISEGRRGNETHYLFPSHDDSLPLTVADLLDYIDLKREIIMDGNAINSSISQPEVWVIFDYDNSLLFDFNETRILDYLSVMFHAVNNRYATIKTLKISFRISGVTVTTSKKAQSYLESNIVPDKSGYDIDKLLLDFSKWVFKNINTGHQFDMVTLISGTDFQRLKGGKYYKQTNGLGYFRGACWNDPKNKAFYGTSVSEDNGGFFKGMFTIAHELAHNVGAEHDGNGIAKDCPWNGGHIMSYEGWGTKNKFYFSECSIKGMEYFIKSKQAACTRVENSKTYLPLSNDNPGHRFDMTTLCRRITKDNSSVPDASKTPDELCKNLECQFTQAPSGILATYTTNWPPGDDAPCGNGGRCWNGICKIQTRESIGLLNEGPTASIKKHKHSLRPRNKRRRKKNFRKGKI